MAKKDRTTGMKSAWELAQERMDRELGSSGEEGRGLSDAIRHEMDAVRKEAEAKLAELEILRESPPADPRAREEAKQSYLRERRFIEQSRDDKLEALRSR